jgi:NAD(P)-dependent dehydrogenase (short-subunit alcohol dehydrogenase family)
MTGLFDLSGRVALITGGRRGIGKAIARGWAEAGASLVLAGRMEDDLLRVRDDLQRATGVKVACVAGDLSRRAVVASTSCSTMLEDSIRNQAIKSPMRFGMIIWS